MITIIFNSHIKSENYNKTIDLLKEAISKRTECKAIPSSLLYFGDRFVFPETDGVLFWDKDKTLIKYIAAPTVNSDEALTVCDDKGFTLERLYKNNIPVPKSYIVPEKFYLEANREIYETIKNNFTYPYILKERCSSYGMGVFKINSEKELKEKLKSERKFIVQEFIENKPAFDIRAYIVGNKVIGGFKRINENNFLTNCEKGAREEPYTVSKEEKEIALKSAKACKAEICGVDIIYKGKSPLVLEVNACAGFIALNKAAGIKSEEIIADYLLKKFKIKN